MSALVDAPEAGSQDRSVMATRHLCDALQLGVLKPKDLKNLSVALAEAATQEIARNAAFAEHVKRIYRDLAATGRPPTRSAQGRKRPTKPPLTPMNYVDPKLFGPDKPLDPYLLQFTYGNHQLRAALDRYPASELKKAAAMVEQRNPGTKPANRGQKPALIAYIMQCLVP